MLVIEISIFPITFMAFLCNLSEKYQALWEILGYSTSIITLFYPESEALIEPYLK